MKKLILMITVLSLAMAGSALAKEKAKSAPAAAPKSAPAASSSSSGGKKYGMAGCGLGSMLMGNKGGQIFAATTNGTSYSQLFGITTGTSNCESKGSETAANQVPVFVAANKVALADDIARGNGETIATLSGVLGCQDSVALGTTLQKNFRSIYPSEQVKAGEVSESIISVVKAESLACNNVI